MAATKPSDETENELKLADPDQTKILLKRLANGPLPFVCAEDPDGNTHLVLHKSKRGKALADAVKKETGAKRVCFGTAAEGGGGLQLNAESKPLTGLRKKVLRYIKDNKITSHTKVKVMEAGREVPDEEEGVAGPAPEAGRSAAPAQTEATPVAESATETAAPATEDAAAPAAASAPANPAADVDQMLGEIEGFNSELTRTLRNLNDPSTHADGAATLDEYLGLVDRLKKRIKNNPRGVKGETVQRFKKVLEREKPLQGLLPKLKGKANPAANNANTNTNANTNAGPRPVNPAAPAGNNNPVGNTGNNNAGPRPVNPAAPGGNNNPTGNTGNNNAGPRPVNPAAPGGNNNPGAPTGNPTGGGPTGTPGQRPANPANPSGNPGGGGSGGSAGQGPADPAAPSGNPAAGGPAGTPGQRQANPANPSGNDGGGGPEANPADASSSESGGASGGASPATPEFLQTTEPTGRAEVNDRGGLSASGNLGTTSFGESTVLTGPAASADAGAWATPGGGTSYGIRGGVTGATLGIDLAHMAGVDDAGIVARVDAAGGSANIEGSMGTESTTLGAGANLGEIAVTLGTQDSATDETIRVGVGEGVGASGRLHYEDADRDGHREYGVGVDVEFLSVDVRSEDPVRSALELVTTGEFSGVFGREENLTDRTIAAAEPVVEAIGQIPGQLREDPVGTVGRALHTDQQVGQEIRQDQQRAVQEGAQMLADAAERLGERAEDLVEGTGQRVGQQVEQTMRRTAERAVDMAENLASAPLELAREAAETVQQTAETVSDIADRVRDVSSTAGQLADQAQQGVANAADRLRQGIGNLFGDDPPAR